MTGRLDEEFRRMTRNASLDASSKLRNTMQRVLDTVFEYRVFLSVIFEYLLHKKQLGADIRQAVRRHTIGMRYLLTHLIREGIERGELAACPADTVGAILHGILESTILQIAATDTADRRLIDAEVDLILERLIDSGAA